MSDISKIKIVNPNQALRCWLVHCYLYYILDTSVIEDYEFDSLTERLIKEWDQIDDPHKSLVTMDDLRAGSGFALSYPLRVEMAAWQVLRDQQAKEKPAEKKTRKKKK